MSTNETKTISEQASVAPNIATMKRSLQMKQFASKQDHKDVAFHETPKVLGQVIGRIIAVSEKEGTLPDGERKVSLLALGQFEGSNYGTGEVFEATSAYLPGYYLEVVRAMLEKQGVEAVDFSIEIELVPTGKSIPTAYEVRNLLRRRPDNPLEVMKRELAAAGRLRLPPPSDAPALIEGEVRHVEPLALEASPAAQEAAQAAQEADEPEVDEAQAEAAQEAAQAKGSRRAKATA